MRQVEDPIDSGFADPTAPSADADWPIDTPQVRSTVNVSVILGSGDAASLNAADPAVREALRDALVAILRDDARRQGLDL